jgi:hypothetical protein
MNERIRECWIKAAREDSSETWDSQKQFIERFAELIVRECADVALREDHEPDECILRHFGVKR